MVKAMKLTKARRDARCLRCGFKSCSCLGGKCHLKGCPVCSSTTATKVQRDRAKRKTRGVRLDIWLDPTFAALLSALAGKRGESKTAVVRAALLALFSAQSRKGET